MPDLYLVIDLIVVVALFVLGLTVLLKNRTLELNRFFAIFVVSVGVWIIANYVSNDIKHAPSTALHANHFVFTFSFIAAIALLQFVIGLANDTKARKVLRKFYIPLALITISCATPLVANGVEVQGRIYAVKFGPVAPVYFITVIVLVLASAYIIHRNIRRTKGNQQARLRVLFRSLYLTFPALIFMQAILPATTGWFGLTNIGILPMLILVFGLYYGAVKHRLFDLRFYAVRAAAYLFILVTTGLLYLLPAIYFISKFLGIQLPQRSIWFLLPVGLVLIIGYGYLRRLLDRLTGKIFFRNDYKPEEFIAELNGTVVSNFEVNRLLQDAARVIVKNFKAEHCTFILHETATTARRNIGVGAIDLSSREESSIHDIVGSSAHRVLVTEYAAAERPGLLKILSEKDIAAFAHLSAHGERTELGYILLGPKKSGQQYNMQDIRTLETIIDGLIVAIQNALRFEEIEQFNVTLQEKINTATHKLQKTNEKLQQIDETKDEFISMASHQLRTPLTSVKGYLSMVIEGDAGPLNDMQHKLLSQAFTSSQRMVFLIADLLNVSRLRTGKFVIEPKPTNLADLVEGEVEQLKETAEGRGLKLSYKKPAKFPELMMDDTKIRQVVMNFMDNAIYYTQSGGHITVELKDHGDTIEYTVTDNGMGVPKHEQHHLFNKFYRAGNARKARPDGTGLGLFMAKKVVVAQGGSIIFKSKEGEGSTFGFTFAKSHLNSLSSPAADPNADTPTLNPVEVPAASK